LREGLLVRVNLGGGLLSRVTCNITGERDGIINCEASAVRIWRGKIDDGHVRSFLN